MDEDPIEGILLACICVAGLILLTLILTH